MRKTLLVLIALVLGFYLLTGFTQIRPGEKGVIRRFGKPLPQLADPGLFIGLPYGMDRVDRIAVDKVNNIAVGFFEDDGGKPLPPGQMLTGDNNLVNVQVTVYYKVEPSMEVDFAINAPIIPEFLKRYVESETAMWIASKTVDEALLAGKISMGPAILNKTAQRIQGCNLGVQLLDVRVSLVAPPDEVKPSFDAVARAQTSVTTMLNKAEQDTESKLRQSESDKFRLEQETLAITNTMILQASKDAERFLARLQQYIEGRKTNPDYLLQIWQDERSKIFAKLRDQGNLGLLDQYLGAGGLEINLMPLGQKTKP